MPEGDTIHRTATTLRAALAGRRTETIRLFDPLRDAEPVDHPGAGIENVESRGKHLIVRFDDGRLLHTHMKMTGQWHVYRPGERWWKAESSARAVITTDAYVAVCFGAPIVRLGPAREIESSPELARLGPDLLAERVDVDEAVRRLRAAGSLPLGEALLRQRAVAGIGNIYKSETLFICRLDPFRPVSSYESSALRRVVTTASRLMRAHTLRGGDLESRLPARGPRYGPRVREWVYRRSGRPCRRCGTLVRMRRQGDLGRSTYYCSHCQGVPAQRRRNGRTPTDDA